MNELNEAWNITAVTVTSYSEESGWWFGASNKLVAKFDIELVAFSTPLPTNEEVEHELNQLDADNMEFKLYESGDLQ